MATSRIPATIDAIIAKFTTAGATVLDGPTITADYSDALFVGYDGDPDGDYVSVDEIATEWQGLGAKTRSEEFDVVCAAVALVGDAVDGVKTARNQVFALLALAENALRSDPSLGQAPPFVAEVQPGLVFIEPAESGYQVRVPFSIHVETRI